MTNKFNVGDTVRILNGHHEHKTGQIKVIDRIQDPKSNPNKWKYGFENHGGWTFEENLELVEPKPTKNQRITALEETVAKQGEEINELKLIVAQIRKPSTVVEEALTNDIIEFEGKQYKKVDREAREGDVVIFNYAGRIPNAIQTNKPYPVNYLHEGDLAHHDGVTTSVCNFRIYDWGRNKNNVDVYELMDGYNPGILMVDETPIKTANQLRAEIIKKAKEFVFEVEGYLAGFQSDRTQGNYAYQDTSGFVKYNTNAEKRTVVALFYNKYTKKLIEKGIAKCMPSDVFNEHIGKAIALGRALGLDVSEFEQAVQPTEIVLGMKVVNDAPDNITNRNIEITVCEPGIGYDDGFAKGERKGAIDSKFMKNKYTKIINDTNAQYGGAE